MITLYGCVYFNPFRKELKSMKKIISEIVAITKAIQAEEDLPTQYEKAQKDVKQLLKQLSDNVEKHGKDFKKSGGKNWGYLGDMNKIKKGLKDLL